MLILVLVATVAAVLLWPTTRSGWSGLARLPGPAGPDVHVRAGPGPTSDPARGLGPRARGRRRRDLVLEEALAELLGLLAAPLRAGVPPAAALAAVEPSTREGPLGVLVADLVRSAEAGDPLATVWDTWAVRWQSDSVGFVARAWSLSEEAGAPLVDALGAAAEGVRARRRAQEHLATTIAGPRASMGVLSLLPLAGPLVGLACGVGPRDLYFSSPVGTLCLAIGLALGALALAWSRRILARAT